MDAGQQKNGYSLFAKHNIWGESVEIRWYLDFFAGKGYAEIKEIQTGSI